MPITITERARSRAVKYDASGAHEPRLYTVRGSMDPVEVFNAILAFAPEVADGLVRRSIQIDPWGDDNGWDAEVEYGTTGQDGSTDALGAPTVPPGNVTGSAPGSDGTVPSTSAMGADYTFDISAETHHTTRSIRTMSSVGEDPGFLDDEGTVWTDKVGTMTPFVGGPTNVVTPAGADYDAEADPAWWVGKAVYITAPPAGWYAGAYRIINAEGGTWTLDRTPCADGAAGAAPWVMKWEAPRSFGGAIGVSDKKVEGCDVWKTRFEWTRTITVRNLNRTYILRLRNLVGKKNAKPFYGSAAGEVLYMGATASYSAQDRWSITHKFAEIANEYNIAIIPGELTVPFKRGWDYLWVSYRTKEVPNADTPTGWQDIMVPEAVYVEEVVADGDFDLIEIGK